MSDYVPVPQPTDPINITIRYAQDYGVVGRLPEPPLPQTFVAGQRTSRFLAPLENNESRPLLRVAHGYGMGLVEADPVPSNTYVRLYAAGAVDGTLTMRGRRSKKIQASRKQSPIGDSELKGLRCAGFYIGFQPEFQACNDIPIACFSTDAGLINLAVRRSPTDYTQWELRMAGPYKQNVLREDSIVWDSPYYAETRTIPYGDSTTFCTVTCASPSRPYILDVDATRSPKFVTLGTFFYADHSQPVHLWVGGGKFRIADLELTHAALTGDIFFGGIGFVIYPYVDLTANLTPSGMVLYRSVTERCVGRFAGVITRAATLLDTTGLSDPANREKVELSPALPTETDTNASFQHLLPSSLLALRMNSLAGPSAVGVGTNSGPGADPAFPGNGTIWEGAASPTFTHIEHRLSETYSLHFGEAYEVNFVGPNDSNPNTWYAETHTAATAPEDYAFTFEAGSNLRGPDSWTSAAYLSAAAGEQCFSIVAPTTNVSVAVPSEMAVAVNAKLVALLSGHPLNGFESKDVRTTTSGTVNTIDYGYTLVDPHDGKTPYHDPLYTPTVDISNAELIQLTRVAGAQFTLTSTITYYAVAGYIGLERNTKPMTGKASVICSMGEAITRPMLMTTTNLGTVQVSSPTTNTVNMATGAPAFYTDRVFVDLIPYGLSPGDMIVVRAQAEANNPPFLTSRTLWNVVTSTGTVRVWKSDGINPTIGDVSDTGVIVADITSYSRAQQEDSWVLGGQHDFVIVTDITPGTVGILVDAERLRDGVPLTLGAPVDKLGIIAVPRGTAYRYAPWQPTGASLIQQATLSDGAEKPERQYNPPPHQTGYADPTDGYYGGAFRLPNLDIFKIVL